VSERDRQVVPLDVIADHSGRIFDAVVPFHTRSALGGVDRVPRTR
jgi:hypothetical protein